MAEVLQLAGSIGAVVLLVLLVRAARLGASPAFSSEEDVRRAVALDGLNLKEIAIDENGRAALMIDETGVVVLLRAHGAHVASRILMPPAQARLENGTLVVDPADRRFGHVRLSIPQPERWKMLINRV